MISVSEVDVPRFGAQTSGAVLDRLLYIAKLKRRAMARIAQAPPTIGPMMDAEPAGASTGPYASYYALQSVMGSALAGGVVALREAEGLAAEAPRQSP